MHFFSGLINQSIGKSCFSFRTKEKKEIIAKNKNRNNINNYIQQSYHSKNLMNKDQASKNPQAIHNPINLEEQTNRIVIAQVR